MVNYIYNNSFVEIEPFRRGKGIGGIVSSAGNAIKRAVAPRRTNPPGSGPQPTEAPVEATVETPPTDAPTTPPTTAQTAPSTTTAQTVPSTTTTPPTTTQQSGQTVSVMSMNPIRKTFALTGFDPTNVYCLLNPDFTFCSSNASDVMDLSQFKVSSTQVYNQIFPNNETQVNWCKMRCLADQNCYAILSTFTATTNSCTFYTSN